MVLVVVVVVVGVGVGVVVVVVVAVRQQWRWAGHVVRATVAQWPAFLTRWRDKLWWQHFKRMGFRYAKSGPKWRWEDMFSLFVESLPNHDALGDEGNEGHVVELSQQVSWYEQAADRVLWKAKEDEFIKWAHNLKTSRLAIMN